MNLLDAIAVLNVLYWAVSVLIVLSMVIAHFFIIEERYR